MARNRFRSESCITSVAVSDVGDTCFMKVTAAFGSAPADLTHSDVMVTGDSEAPDASWWDCHYGD